MLEARAVVITPAFKNKPVETESAKLAQELAALYANNFRLALITSKKVATAKTLQSVKIGKTLDSPSRGIFLRNVSAKKSWIFIQRGRRKGGKMPIVKGKDGKFQPVPELLEWFAALNIPRKAWFPILRKIARDGIKPKNIQGKMMREARPRQAALAKATGNRIAKQLEMTASRNVLTN